MGFSTNDSEHAELERMADGYVADIAKLESGEWPEGFEPDGFDSEDPVSAWLDRQLEIYVDYRRSIGHDTEPVVSGFGVLLAYGGPGARLEIDAAGDAQVRVYSWGDEVVRHVTADAIGDRLSEVEEL